MQRSNINNKGLYIDRSEIVEYDFLRRRRSYRIRVNKRGKEFILNLLPDRHRFYVEYGEREEGKILGQNNKVLGIYTETSHGLYINWR